MDSFKLGIFLLLIAAATVATLGSPVIEKQPGVSSESQELMELEPNPNHYDEELEPNPNDDDEELEPNPNDDDEELEPNPNDNDEKESKRGVVAVIEGAALGVELLNGVLDALGKVSRKIAIGIENESGKTWTANNVYFYSGTSDAVIPHTVPTGKALLYGVRKTSFSTYGVGGMLTYYFEGVGVTLAVMFDAPWQYITNDNMWNVDCYAGNIQASKALYHELYDGKANRYPFKGDNGYHYRNFVSFRVRGVMSSSGAATLEIHVEKK